MLDQALARDIIAAVDAGFDEQVRETAALTAIPSLRGQEASAQDFMAAQYRRRGLSVDHWKIEVADIQHLPGFSPVAISYDNAYNVVGTHRPREKKGRSLILNGHIDVVPTGPADLWTRPPFDVYEKEGWLYGRGGGDMKAGLYANLAAFDALARLGLQPAAEVYQQSVVEEECTGNGALACLQRGYRGEAAIIPEPMGDCVLSGQLGVMWFQVKVRGKPVHVAYAGTGSNAIEAAWPVIQALHELEESWNAARHEMWQEHRHPINFVVSKIAGGDWTSSVPAWCTFDMRISFFPGMELERVRREVEETVRKASAKHSFLANNPPEVVYHGFQAEPYVVKDADAALACLEGAHRLAFNAELSRVATTATTDARFFGLYADTPALVYGPLAEDIHGFDERVNLDSLRKITQGIALFMADWCGVEKRH
ncbi:acetylornithine deacetylase [Dongia mobilis]|uniref:Acetylornithine deacetylase n=1 Tax=Dongia mobilis TaxID=578943 RepID=A0A4R6WWR3_9PROT|nr:ArgE/DapE family deacylase [Dongia mobilis]TDQ83823.1 acetylornithine deacetylase [Dongia mobilis]